MAPKRKKTKATAAKAAPAPSPPSRRVSQKRSAQPVPPADHEVRGAKAKKSNLSAGNEKAIVPAKRTKKTSSGDDGSIETLKQAGVLLIHLIICKLICYTNFRFELGSCKTTSLKPT